jgi:oligopeptide/dipeptide ABC transporter ATP-binding protein
LGVVGESGCGKSTLARILMGLIPQEGGCIIFDGDLVGGPQGLSLRELRRNMQIVFQDSDSSLNPRLSIVDSIGYGPRVHGMRRAEARTLAHDLLQRVGLDPALFASRYPHELSGGEIGLTDAIYREPKHPYTKALLESRLATDPRRRVETAPLADDPPNTVDPPSGCRFRTRCPFAEDICAIKSPPLGGSGNHAAHLVACHMDKPQSGHSRARMGPVPLRRAADAVGC